MADIQLDIPDIGVIVSRPEIIQEDVLLSDVSVVLQQGDSYITNVNIPHLVTIEKENYFVVADLALVANTASYVEYDNVANKPTLISSSVQFTDSTAPFTGSFSGSFFGDGSDLTGIAADLFLAGDTGSSSVNLKTTTLQVVGGNAIGTSVSGAFLEIRGVDGLVSSSTQINTGSFSGSFIGDGSQLTGLVTDLRISGSIGSDVISLLTDDLTLSGENGIITRVEQNSVIIVLPTGSVSASSQIDHNATTNYVVTEHIDHLTVSMSAGLGLSGGGDLTTSRTFTVVTESGHFIDGVVAVLNANTVVSGSDQVVGLLPSGTVSSSTQVDYTQLQNLPSIIATASYVDYDNIDNKPTLVSSSTQINTGSFSGSFIGDGSQLTGIATDLSFAGDTGTSSINLKTTTLEIVGGSGIQTSVSGNRLDLVAAKGVVSASSQIDYTDIQNKPTIIPTASYVEYTAIANTPTLISASTQVSYVELQNIPSGIVSSSAQINTGSFSGSFIGDLTGTGSWSVKTVSPTFVQDSAPTNPLEGALWWDEDSGKLFVYYDDGSSAQWVQALPDILAEGPVGTFTLGGNLVISGDTTVQGTLFETSDVRLKTNIKEISNGLSLIEQIRAVEFDWIRSKQHSYGVIAQEVEAHFPFLVNTTEVSGAKTVNYTALIGILIQAIKELNDKVNQLSNTPQ
jgi:hypothetical protein